MRFTMTRPCDLCPFVRGGLLLTKNRARELGGQIVDCDGQAGGGAFICHKTGDEGEESGLILGDKDSQHCAGALIFAEKQDAPTQIMRIAERLGRYNRVKLDMTANVFNSLAEMIDAGM